MDESEESSVVEKEWRRGELAKAAKADAALRQLRKLNPTPEEMMKAFPDEKVRLREEAHRIADDIARVEEDVAAGRKSSEEAAPRIDELSQQMEAAIQFSDIPGLVMSNRATKEAENTGLPRIARFLIADANQWAAWGMSQYGWIAQVLKGHAGDEQAQAAVLAHIIKLWSEGPWPWLREDLGQGAA
jgi:hypothetical protein